MDRNLALKIYVRGLGTGIQTATFNLGQGRITPAESNAMANDAVHSLLADPLQRLAIENEVDALLAGKPSPNNSLAPIPPTGDLS